MVIITNQCPKCGRTSSDSYCKFCRTPMRRFEIEQMTLGLFDDDEKDVQVEPTRPQLQLIPGGRRDLV
ncbi:hypothetical protein SAMN05421543_11529 [Alicyclobacillus macrosporangiidus]|uniref:Uncharacterized protein n=1 Tax=Alicyclobacillus macrosporangiidus TaxID=392015 RepID=A0A1I7KCG8_9BACL|nr:hypothetical protein SAMN05421543_11529 [Alicyclobacillus macrosporangiidus]